MNDITISWEMFAIAVFAVCASYIMFGYLCINQAFKINNLIHRYKTYEDMVNCLHKILDKKQQEISKLLLENKTLEIQLSSKST